MSDVDQNVNHEVTAGERPAGGTAPRRPARQFLAEGGRSGNGKGYRGSPVRQPHHDVVADEQVFTEQPSPEVLEQIRAASSLVDEPECVGPAILDVFSADARYYGSLRHQAEVQAAREVRQTLTLEQRLDDVERRAKRVHVDLRRGLQDARATLRRARAGGRNPNGALVRLVERMEERLDGPVDEAA